MSGKKSLATFLSSIGLETYLERLVAEGFDDVKTLSTLNQPELLGLGFKLGHCKKLLMALRELDGPKLPLCIERASYEACLQSQTEDRSNDQVRRARVSYAAFLRGGERALAAEQARCRVDTARRGDLEGMRLVSAHSYGVEPSPPFGSGHGRDVCSWRKPCRARTSERCKRCSSAKQRSTAACAARSASTPI